MRLMAYVLPTHNQETTAASMALVKEEIFEALKQAYDPEIPVDIVNLGLVYEVRVEKGLLYVKITTTAPDCPVSNFDCSANQEAYSRSSGS